MNKIVILSFLLFQIGTLFASDDSGDIIKIDGKEFNVTHEGGNTRIKEVSCDMQYNGTSMIHSSNRMCSNYWFYEIGDDIETAENELHSHRDNEEKYAKNNNGIYVHMSYAEKISLATNAIEKKEGIKIDKKYYWSPDRKFTQLVEKENGFCSIWGPNDVAQRNKPMIIGFTIKNTGENIKGSEE